MTAAGSLVLECQLKADFAVWVAIGGTTFFPPDFAASGIDLSALPVIRVDGSVSAAQAAEQLLRSGGFGVVVIDLGEATDMRVSVQARLAALAKKHNTAVVCLTQKPREADSLGPMVSLRCEAMMRQTGFNQFAWDIHVLKDRLRGVKTWKHSEVCRGPDGMC